MSRLPLGEEQGATMVEYSIMVVLIAAVCIALVATIGEEVSGIFNEAVGFF